MRVLVAVCSSLLAIYGLAGLTGSSMWTQGATEQRACMLLGLCADDILRESAFGALRSPDPEVQLASIPVFVELIRRDPASASAWCDLGGAHLATGDGASARLALHRASELGGNVSSVLVRLAAFSFSVQDTAGVLTRLRRVLADTPRYDQVAFSMYSRLGETPQTVINRGIPGDLRAGNAYLRFLLARGDVADVGLAWNAWTRRFPVDDTVAAGYVKLLWENKQEHEAYRVWKSRFGTGIPGYGWLNHVYNGGFERDLSQGIFDWNISAVSYATAAFDRLATEGQRSLRLTFDGLDNPGYGAVSQIMLLEPGSYRFSARMKAEELSSDQGIRFRIADPRLSRRLEVWTKDVRGSVDWATVTANFVVTSASRLVEVRIARLPSLRFDNKLGGTVWVDDVKVARVW